MLGSFEFVERLVEDGVPPERIFFLNLDMIGNAEGPGPWRVKIHDNVPSRPLAQLAARICTAYTPLQPLMAGVRDADHANFHDKGYRAIFLHEGDFNTQNYHSVTDLLRYLEMDYLEQAAEAATAIVLHMATLVSPPEDLAARETADGAIAVQWTHSQDADVVGYHVELLDRLGEVVLRKSTPEDFVLLDAVDVAGASTVRVRAEDTLGESEPSAAVPVGSGGGVAASVAPNPTVGPCRLHVFVPGTGEPVDAIARIVDVAGRLVAVLHDAPLERGSSVLEWSGRCSDGSPAPSGVYFFTLETDATGTARGRIVVAR
jgi:hypothetical protein